MFLTFYLTVKAVHVQHHVGLLPIGRPLQQRQRIGPRCLRGRAWAELCLLTGLDESVLQQRLASSRTVVGHKPREEFTWCFFLSSIIPSTQLEGEYTVHMCNGGNKSLTSAGICPSWVRGRSCRRRPAAAASLAQRCRCCCFSTPG